LPFSAGCIQRHEWKRTSAADSGRSDVAGAGAGRSAGAGAAAPGSAASVCVLLLKLYANGLLQRAKGAQFFRRDERQRPSG
jgi:hypothetical protein